MSKEKRRLAIKFLQNLPFRDFKESEHMKGTVKLWQESEKEKKYFPHLKTIKLQQEHFSLLCFL